MGSEACRPGVGNESDGPGGGAQRLDVAAPSPRPRASEVADALAQPAGLARTGVPQLGEQMGDAVAGGEVVTRQVFLTAPECQSARRRL